jgi:lipopolysaccharide/colanic/teichoic acid biosynthesis glycosyltransferase
MTAVESGLKRGFDLVLSVGGVVVLSPMMGVIAVAVALESLPVLFIQDRIGREGRVFRVMKFRTMVRNATGTTVTTAGDARITPLGRLLRRFKLDELPQLFNVLLGDMSLVGPRPDVPGYADRLSGSDREVLCLRPGITGPASLVFRNEEALLATVPDAREFNDRVIWPAKVAINRRYLAEWSLARDMGYLLITVVPALDRVFGLLRPFEGGWEGDSGAGRKR